MVTQLWLASEPVPALLLLRGRQHSSFHTNLTGLGQPCCLFLGKSVFLLEKVLSKKLKLRSWNQQGVHLESEDNKTYLGTWVWELSKPGHVRLLAHNRYSVNGTHYEYVQYCFSKSYHALFLWQISEEVAESWKTHSGQPYTGASCRVPPSSLDVHLQTLARALGGSWTGLTAVRTKSGLYT